MIQFILEGLTRSTEVPIETVSYRPALTVVESASSSYLRPLAFFGPIAYLSSESQPAVNISNKKRVPKIGPLYGYRILEPSKSSHARKLTLPVVPKSTKNQLLPLVISQCKAKPSISHTKDFLKSIGLEPSSPEKILTSSVEPKVSPFSSAQPFALLTPEKTNRAVTLSLSSTPLETVIRLLSKQTGINIVLLSKPDQKVTINVKDITLNEALQHLAAISGLKSLKVKNAIVMADEATLKAGYPKEFSTEFEAKPTPPLTSTKSEPATNSSSSTTSEPATVVAEKDITKVIVTKFSSATQLTTALKDFLQTKKVQIIALPTSLVPTIDAAGGVMAAQGNGGVAAGVIGGDRGNGETGSRRILLNGPASEVEKAIALINELDVQRKQVEITVTIHDVSNDALKEEGFAWTFGNFTISENNSNSINFGTFNRTGLSFQSAIKALEKADKAKLLASPNISAMDGERAYILIGERRQFPIVNGTTPTGQFIYSTQEQNIGIYLQVSADVASDGTITLAVKPQVSAIIGFLNVNGASYPQLSTRESQSTLSLKSGDTMLLGGLLRDEEIRNLEQVPFLSKIPLFGELFKNRRTERRSSQLVISITPKLIEHK